MIVGHHPAAFVLLARLVLLCIRAAGRARSLSLLGCPTVLPAHGCSPVGACTGDYVRCTRKRVFNNYSLCEKEVIKVGQWGTAPNVGAFRGPALILNSGTEGQTPEKRKPIRGVRRYKWGVGVALPTYSSVTLIQACCHRNRPVKSGYLRRVRAQKALEKTGRTGRFFYVCASMLYIASRTRIALTIAGIANPNPVYATAFHKHAINSKTACRVRGAVLRPNSTTCQIQKADIAKEHKVARIRVVVVNHFLSLPRTFCWSSTGVRIQSLTNLNIPVSDNRTPSTTPAFPTISMTTLYPKI